MIELAQKFLNKECIIYTFNSQFTGTIKEVNEGGLLIEKSGTLEAVNFDFIVRIREYPKNKNKRAQGKGKKHGFHVTPQAKILRGYSIMNIAIFQPRFNLGFD